MSSRLTTDRTTTAFDVLADPERRALLSTLSERGESTPVDALATEVATHTHGTPIVTTDQVRTAHIELVHHHVPKLVDLGVLCERNDGDARTVALADHPLLEAEWVSYLLENPTGGPGIDESRLNRTLETLRPARRRLVCDVLARRTDDLDGLDVADLAVLIAAREGDRRLVDLEESDWRPVATSLVHAHLPALADVGLVEYDRSSGAVSIAADATQWRAEWLAASPLGEVAAVLESSRRRRNGRPGSGATGTRFADGEGACWTIEGYERVAERGYELADAATTELFVTIPDRELLQPRYLERWQAAVDRGVDVYVGSRSDDVRKLVGAAIPEATICEPQFDWLNFPVDGLHHGRVAFADRERVMLVTVDDAAGDLRATAITGDGPENALVSLVREQLCPRLDRLQARREDGEGADEWTTPLPL